MTSIASPNHLSHSQQDVRSANRTCNPQTGCAIHQHDIQSAVYQEVWLLACHAPGVVWQVRGHSLEEGFIPHGVQSFLHSVRLLLGVVRVGVRENTDLDEGIRQSVGIHGREIGSLNNWEVDNGGREGGREEMSVLCRMKQGWREGGGQEREKNGGERE